LSAAVCMLILSNQFMSAEVALSTSELCCL